MEYGQKWAEYFIPGITNKATAKESNKVRARRMGFT
jgi:hypothetical protein